MKNHETVRPRTQGQLKDIAATMIGHIPNQTYTEAKDITSNKGWFGYQIQQIFTRFADISTHSAVVDYRRSFQGMIHVCSFDTVDDAITAEHFPVKGKRRHELLVTLFRFGEGTRGDNAVAELDKGGYRSANIEEFLAFCERYRSPKKALRVVALGSFYRLGPAGTGARMVPYFLQTDGMRHLKCGFFGTVWDNTYFAAVPKSR
ncbi:hypothetical protein MYX06_02755 [Patescibacteria group bacterium AH-259-L05]|nr:hypothetical protein [Patescibacteria group bacterium AH-259-L05]